VQQAAQVAAQEGVGAGLGQAGELVVGEAAGDLGVFHAEAAAEAAAHLGVGHLGELQPAHAAEQQARLGLDAELAQARAGVEVADGAGVGGVVVVTPRTSVRKEISSKLLAASASARARQGGSSAKRRGNPCGSSPCTSRRADHVVETFEGLDELLRERPGGVEIAAVIGRLAATGLIKGHFDGASGRFQQLYRGKPTLGRNRFIRQVAKRPTRGGMDDSLKTGRAAGGRGWWAGGGHCPF
jgi:hypothetical protein